jgi:hypothetical protein
MSSMTTLYRAIVMIATGIVVVKGWQLCGPSTQQVKSAALRALELAQEALNQSPQEGSAGGALVADPRTDPSAFEAAGGISPSVSPAAAPPLLGGDAPAAAAQLPVTGQASAEPPGLSMTHPETMPKLAGADAERLPELLSRLEGLGVAEPQLAAWGSSGHMYRFSCRAKIGDSPGLARHFESVAAEPLVAVEQVVAKVEAWRTADRGAQLLR